MKFICSIASAMLTLVGCSNKQDETTASNDIIVGGLYASTNESGEFIIAKVLAVDQSAVHVRIYKNRFSQLPKDLDSSVLSLGKLGDTDGFGIGHAPVARQGWVEKHVFLGKEPVLEEELEGYKIYLDAMK